MAGFSRCNHRIHDDLHDLLLQPAPSKLLCLVDGLKEHGVPGSVADLLYQGSHKRGLCPLVHWQPPAHRRCKVYIFCADLMTLAEQAVQGVMQFLDQPSVKRQLQEYWQHPVLQQALQQYGPELIKLGIHNPRLAKSLYGMLAQPSNVNIPATNNRTNRSPNVSPPRAPAGNTSRIL